MARSQRRDRWFVAALVVIPIAMYVPLSLSGHPLMPGDQLQQNYPLRVFAGELLRSGRLPAWNPVIWSGTPLIAGWNAGAMFPATFLFAIFSPLVAWTFNIVLVPVFASIGMYVLVRRLGGNDYAALTGALLFTYTGFMAGQIVHLGLEQGTACMPWMLLAIDGVARHRSMRSQIGWVAVLGAAFGLDVLAGDPRSVTSGIIASGVFMLACAVRKNVQLIRFVAMMATAAALGAAVSAVQWLPGLSFLQTSQRKHAAYAFFGAGSLTIPHLASLLVSPFMLGGNGNFDMPGYIGSYNLPELTIGSGFVAAVAAGAYLPELVSSIAGFIRTRQRRVLARPLGVWYVMAIVGLALSLGNNTALGHLLVHLPLYGHERLQNRNAILFDVSLAVLASFLVHDLTVKQPAAGDAESVRAHIFLNRGEKLLGLLPIAGFFLQLIVAFALPLRLEFDLHAIVSRSDLYTHLLGYLIPSAIVAGTCGLIVFVAWRMPLRLRRVVVSALVLADVGIYVAFGDWSTAPTSLLASSNSLSKSVAAATGSNGRFAIYNPAFYTGLGPNDPVFSMGLPDVNILQDIPSVQGYGSIVDGIYQEATSTHQVQQLTVSRLNGESFNTLDLRALYTLPAYFGENLSPGEPIPVLNASSPPGAPGPPLYHSYARVITPGHSAEYELATPELVTSVTIVLNKTTQPFPAEISIRAVNTNGVLHRVSAAVTDGEAHLNFAKSVRANTIYVENQSGPSVPVGAVEVDTTSPTQRIVLDGILQGQVLSPHWRYSGQLGQFVLFKNTETLGLAWLQPVKLNHPTTASRALGSVHVINNSAIAPQVMLVNAPERAALVRSETYAPGWTAKITPVSGGKSQTLTARPFGLVQSVKIPAGDWRVTWHYGPPRLLDGVFISILGLVALLVSLIAVLIWRTQRVARLMRRVANTHNHHI